MSAVKEFLNIRIINSWFLDEISSFFTSFSGFLLVFMVLIGENKIRMGDFEIILGSAAKNVKKSEDFRIKIYKSVQRITEETN